MPPKLTNAVVFKDAFKWNPLYKKMNVKQGKQRTYIAFCPMKSWQCSHGDQEEYRNEGTLLKERILYVRHEQTIVAFQIVSSCS
jgi:hypothetical protein